MARVCEICGKGKQNGHSVSHSNIKTKRSFNANLQNIKIELNGTVKKALASTQSLNGYRNELLETSVITTNAAARQSAAGITARRSHNFAPPEGTARSALFSLIIMWAGQMPTTLRMRRAAAIGTHMRGF